MKTEIGSYEAKTRLPELLREVKQGRSFTITKRGRPIADLVPSTDAAVIDRAAAVDAMLEFMQTNRVELKGITIKELIEEGRD